jgi:hypothetical protein
MKVVYILMVFMLLVGSCSKEEELISGSISGIVATYNQFDYLYSDQSNVEVLLLQDTSLLKNTFTDSRGQYQFENIPYGKYTINLKMEGFVQNRSYHTVYHIGGASPTIVNFSLYEIPRYELSIDSVNCSSGFFNMIIYLKINGDTILPSKYGNWFIGFAANSPDVTRYNYFSRVKGILLDYNLNGAVYGMVYLYDYDMEQLKSDTIYLRIYPLASGQGYFIDDYYPEALGKPSNVFGFLYE